MEFENLFGSEHMFRNNTKKKVLYSKTYQSAESETKGEGYRLEETN